MIKLWTRQDLHDKIQWQGQDFFWKEDCPFCDVDWQKWHTLWQGEYWYILHNIYPYSGNELHIMAVPYEHKIYSTELNEAELKELQIVYKKVKEFFWEENYFSCVRESMINRSVEHYHIHFIPWRLQGKYLRKMLERQGFPIIEDLDI